MIVTYEDAISYIYSFVDYERLTSPSYKKKERSPALFKNFLRDIGSPEESFPVIHIAGTKGKGSVAIMVTYILKEAGFRVGTYTSPHLTDVRERIVLDGQPIGKREFLSLFLEILPQLEKRKKERTYRTVFEILTAISFLYFKKREVDIGVIEVGLGGRLDATNVFERSTSVITNISFDHTKILGNRLIEIADDKSEIIKPDSLVVCSPQREKVTSVIREKALARNCRFLYTGDYKYTIKEKNERGSIFDVRTEEKEYRDVKLSLPGSFQIENALTAIGVVEGLTHRGRGGKTGAQVLIDSNIQRCEDIKKRRFEDAIYQGLASVRWRGRLEVLRHSPYLVVDGAHNVYSMEVLAKEIKDIFDYKRLILIFGVNRDKDIKGMLKAIVPLSDVIILTRTDFPRSADPLTMKDMVKQHSPVVSKDIKEALEIAYRIATKCDLILITGSFYLVGEAIEAVC
jgi:dihydrofolate synthase/folylpolyglutamate synthase